MCSLTEDGAFLFRRVLYLLDLPALSVCQILDGSEGHVKPESCFQQSIYFSFSKSFPGESLAWHEIDHPLNLKSFWFQGSVWNLQFMFIIKRMEFRSFAFPLILKVSECQSWCQFVHFRFRKLCKFCKKVPGAINAKTYYTVKLSLGPLLTLLL